MQHCSLAIAEAGALSSARSGGWAATSAPGRWPARAASGEAAAVGGGGASPRQIQKCWARHDNLQVALVEVELALSARRTAVRAGELSGGTTARATARVVDGGIVDLRAQSARSACDRCAI